MSSHDSISTVYKCMLRGAADYLVKPIRKNELRNLWQHVWRRQSVGLLLTFFQFFPLFSLQYSEFIDNWLKFYIMCLLCQSTVGINGPQDESVAQQKVEATAENNDASIHSSGDTACIQRNKELIEKGSDAQVSFPDLEIIVFRIVAVI